MAGRLEGKIALVTGSSRGIGKGIADAMTEEGATVWRADILPIEGGDDRCLAQDVTRMDDWLAARNAIKQRDGTLDVLVNNAGIELRAPLKDITLDVKPFFGSEVGRPQAAPKARSVRINRSLRQVTLVS